MGPTVVLFLIFWVTSMLFSWVVAPVLIPTRGSMWGFLFSASSLTLVISCLIDTNHSNKCEAVSHCGFICISLITSDVEHLFDYLYHLYVCLGNLPVEVFSPCVLIGLLVCNGWVMSSLYVLDISPLSEVVCGNISFHSVGCLFILLMVSFACINFLSDIVKCVHISKFWPMDVCRNTWNF